MNEQANSPATTRQGSETRITSSPPRIALAVLCVAITGLFVATLFIWATTALTSDWSTSGWIAVAYVGLSTVGIIAFGSMAYGLIRNRILAIQTGFAIFAAGAVVQIIITLTMSQ